jgi:hypothetical protein
MQKKIKKYQPGGPTTKPNFNLQAMPAYPPPSPPKPKKEKKSKKVEPTSVYSNPRDLPSVRMDKTGQPVKKKMGGTIKKKK